MKIRIALLASEKQKMITFLRVNQDAFAWKHDSMLKIDRKII